MINTQNIESTKGIIKVNIVIARLFDSASIGCVLPKKAIEFCSRKTLKVLIKFTGGIVEKIF